MRIFVSWLGSADLKAPDAEDKTDLGPVAHTLEDRVFDRALLLADQDRRRVRKYESWLRARVGRKKRFELAMVRVELTSPTNFEEIYTAVTNNLDQELKRLAMKPQLSFNLSSGTPAMAATWVILGKNQIPSGTPASLPSKGCGNSLRSFRYCALSRICDRRAAPAGSATRKIKRRRRGRAFEIRGYHLPRSGDAAIDRARSQSGAAISADSH